jgi:hypothetical protein
MKNFALNPMKKLPLEATFLWSLMRCYIFVIKKQSFGVEGVLSNYPRACLWRMWKSKHLNSEEDGGCVATAGG